MWPRDPWDDPKTRKVGAYHIMVKYRRTYYMRSHENEEIPYDIEITIGWWENNEWLLFGIAEPIQEEQVEIVAAEIKEYDNWV